METADYERYKLLIEKTIKTINTAFSERPNNFLTEGDLQAYLYNNFYRQSIFCNYGPGVALVHSEFPTITKINKTKGAFDIAIINPEGAKNLADNLRNNRENELKDMIKTNFELLAAIEIKFVWSLSKNEKAVAKVIHSIIKDADKLQREGKNIKFKYVLAFFNFKIDAEFNKELKKICTDYENEVYEKKVKIMCCSRTKWHL